MLNTVITDLSRLRRRVRRLLGSMRRHPWLTTLIFVSAWLIFSIGGGTAIMAFAADGDGVITLSFLPPFALTDTAGVPMYQYVVLPYDHGGIPWAIDDWFFSRIIDPIWISHVTWISWMLWLLHFLLAFEWVSWIAAPLEAIFTVISPLLTGVGWVPLALGIAALILTIQLIRGRTAAGVSETAISICAAAVVLALASNPIALLTADDGAFATVQRFGGSFAAAIATDNADLLSTPPTGSEASEAIASTLAGQIIDVWVRIPAQEIMYGKPLGGECVQLFNEQMIARENPLDGNSSTVRDAIKQCDEKAGFNAENPSWGSLMSTMSMIGGAIVLLGLNLIVGILLFLAVMYVAFNVYKLIFATAAAIIPGVARRAVVQSAVSVATGLLVTVVVVSIVAIALRMITGMVLTLAEKGWPVISQMWVVNTVTLIMSVSLVVIVVKMKKSGKTLADRMKSRQSKPLSPIRQEMGRAVQRYSAGSSAMKVVGTTIRGGALAGAAAAGGMALKQSAKKRRGSVEPAAATTPGPTEGQQETPTSTPLSAEENVGGTPAVAPAASDPVRPKLRITSDGLGGNVVVRDTSPAQRPQRRTGERSITPLEQGTTPVPQPSSAQRDRGLAIKHDLERIRDGFAPQNWSGWEDLSPREQRNHTRSMERDLLRLRRAQNPEHPPLPQWGGGKPTSTTRQRLQRAVSRHETVPDVRGDRA